jgi:hypothetical protein
LLQRIRDDLARPVGESLFGRVVAGEHRAPVGSSAEVAVQSTPANGAPSRPPAPSTPRGVISIW